MSDQTNLEDQAFDQIKAMMIGMLVDMLYEEMGESTEAMRGAEIVFTQLVAGLRIATSGESEGYAGTVFESNFLDIATEFVKRLRAMRAPWPGNDDETEPVKSNDE